MMEGKMKKKMETVKSGERIKYKRQEKWSARGARYFVCCVLKEVESRAASTLSLAK